MDYIRVSVSTSGEGIEPVIGALSALGLDCLEIIEDESLIEKELSRIKGQWDVADPRELTGGTGPCVRVYIPADEFERGRGRTLDDIRVKMEWLRSLELGLELGELRVTEETVCEEDWANNWKAYFRPTRVGKKIIIKPTWEAYEPLVGDLVLELDPGMAFGTGTHETTALCIEAIEDALQPGDTITDIGCGSGILSIAGCLLGARDILAVDIDPIAVRVSRENVERNGLSDKIRCIEADLLQDTSAEPSNIVVANIIADVILRLMPAAYTNTLAGGTFITSGIIDDREDEIIQAAESAGFTLKKALARGVWRALVFIKPL